QLVKELADAVAAHEQMLESAIHHATPARGEPMRAPALAPEPVERPDAADRAELGAPERPAGRPLSGPFKGMEQTAIVAQIARAVEANRVDLFLQPIVTLP